MIPLLASLALAGDCDPTASVARLQKSGSQADYLCLMKAPEGKDLLVGALLETPTDNERLTRGLVLWLLEHTDQEMDESLISRLNPADRRLLADGIRARRGRASPAPEHVKVFEQLGWYEPVPNYTDARLRPVDRKNLDKVDPKVRVVEAAPAAPTPDAPPVPVAPPVSAGTPNLCGCASAPTSPAVLGGLLVLFGIRRRHPR